MPTGQAFPVSQWPILIFLRAAFLHVSPESCRFAWCRMPLVIYLDVISYLTNILADPVGGHGRAACSHGNPTECTFDCDEGCVLIPRYLFFILADLLFCMLVTGFKVTDVCMGPQALARLELVNLMYHLCTASAIGPVVASKLQKSPVREHDVVRYPLIITPRLTIKPDSQLVLRAKNNWALVETLLHLNASLNAATGANQLLCLA